MPGSLYPQRSGPSSAARSIRPCKGQRTLRWRAGRNGRRVVAAFIATGVPSPPKAGLGWATAFAQNDAEAAKAQWRKIADQLRPTIPKLAALMDEAETDVLAYMAFPAAHRTKLHSVNPLERLNGEIKRRTDMVGSRASLSTPQRGRDHPAGRRPPAGAVRRVGRPADPLHDP